MVERKLNLPAFCLSLFVTAYFLGAIPFSYLIAKQKGVDLRHIGSGNLGSTNAYRALGLVPALVIFVLDALKGGIPTWLAMMYFPEQPLIHVGVGVTAIVGHSLSIFVKFKGGKGAATGIGVLAVLSPITFFIIFPLAVILILLTRYVAPVTLFCCVLTPILMWQFNAPLEYVSVVATICILIIIRHKANILRLINGREHRL